MLAAYAVFLWRYLNVLKNWSYVASIWSIRIFLLTIALEIAFPAVYRRIRAQGYRPRATRREATTNGRQD